MSTKKKKEGMNIKVAIRVRHFIDREVKRKEQMIISMTDNNVRIKAKDGGSRTFQFDRAYWSHDGYVVEEDGYYAPKSPHYIDQKKVFDDLGKDLLQNAWDGYNCSIFAYGQTGSGKSYTIMGRYPNDGLVPMLCKGLFEDIKEAEMKYDGDVLFQVSFSMLEIYKEQVRDLLAKGKPDENIRAVREDSMKGIFFVEGLKEIAVKEYDEINKLLERGNSQKYQAATAMNDVSSRSHTIATVKFTQIFGKENKSKISEIKLVDLAGSENSKQSETSGARLQEGSKINKSLFQLGLCIELLYKNGQIKPDFKSSKLTKLMKNALGGNSKTVMIATISPASGSYELTLSTLKYAERTSQIENKATVNQRNLEEQRNEAIDKKRGQLRLAEKLKKSPANENEIADLKREIEELKSKKISDNQYWKGELEKAKREMDGMEQTYEAKRKTLKVPHIVNISEDPMLSYRVCHILIEGKSFIVGSNKNQGRVDIPLFGSSIRYQHASLENKKGVVNLTSIDGLIRHKGGVLEIGQTTPLQHLDPILFGENYSSGLFLFIDPASDNKHFQRDISFEQCVCKISENEKDNETNDVYLKGLVNQIKGFCNEARSMAKKHKRDMEFRPVLLPEICLGIDSDNFRPFAIATCSDHKFYMEKDDIIDLCGEMQDFDDDLEQKTDPLQISPSRATRVGIASVPHWPDQSKPNVQNVDIFDFQREIIGNLRVEMVSCSSDGGKPKSKSQPKVDKPFYFKIVINKARGLPEGYRFYWCEYKFTATEDTYVTKEVEGRCPEFLSCTVIGTDKATPLFVETLKEKPLLIQLWGRYEKLKDDVPYLSSRNNTLPKGFTADDLQATNTQTEELKRKISDLEQKLEEERKEKERLRSLLGSQ